MPEPGSKAACVFVRRTPRATQRGEVGGRQASSRSGLIKDVDQRSSKVKKEANCKEARGSHVVCRWRDR
eukprot:1580308-Prymnesium_polylepis.2